MAQPQMARSTYTIETASWIVVSRDTGQAVFETFSPKIASAINTQKYRAIPVSDYLGTLNAAIRNAGGVNPPTSPFAAREVV